MKEIEKAKAEFRYLLDHKYDRSSALRFVGDHYRLNKFDRNLVLRVVCSAEEERKRKKKRIPVARIRGKELFVDGYNVFIGTEAILENKELRCQDGFIRDAFGFFGRYRMSNKTIRSMANVLKLLKKYEPKSVTIIFDSQISKSGELANLVNAELKRIGLNGEARTSRSVDGELKKAGGITATSDTIIIDAVKMVLDIPYEIKKEKYA